MKRMEVFILSGFLGSGKTTLLQHFLKREKLLNRKVAVLLNELGEHSIDTAIIGQDTPITELLNGCICCTLKDELEIQILTLFQKERPDVLYIETTGVAHPLEVVDACLSPVISSFIDLKPIITIVDLNKWRELKNLNGSLQKLLEEQVKYADYVLLNKVDLVHKNKLDSIRDEMIKLNPRANIILTTRSKLLLEGIFQSKQPGKIDHQKIHVHHHLNIQTMTYKFESSLNRKEFQSWIDNLPTTIYRIKGFLQFMDDQEHTYLFQYSYKMPYVFPQKTPFPNNLIIIGEQLDIEKLKRELVMLENNMVTTNP